ncbi:FkbM family methyltransferase [Pseudovibrio sp. Tun.PSC04-5.I4]|uniref:FkbM family methyltransferase n=1 Tax=Pseudovibrio sp. Tun.PSC04-5.I4 TaxID=1798213 RepID=UPI00135641F9|nr:FkbM family methyltransferase [Pseudovibrio sp. Tun.PSC04-5.I4]
MGDIENPINVPHFYGQHAEDLVVFGLLKARFQQQRFRDWSYLDIGANHPVHCSNTYLFYRCGASGVAVEPNREMAQLFKKHRPRDRVIIAGAKFDERDTAKFRITENNLLSTFSLEFIDSWKRVNGSGAKIISSEDIALVDINDLVQENFLEKNRKLHLLNIDVEGYDLQVLKRIDFRIAQPEVIVVEYIVPGQPELSKEFCEILESNNYILIYRGRLNLIFLRNRGEDKI